MSKLKVDQISKATGASPAIFTLPAADGTAGQLMKTDGSGNLGFVSSAVGGKVLQVISDGTSTNWSSTSTSYADTDLSVSITPASSSNKVLVTVSANYGRANLTGAYGLYKLLRDSTSIAEGSFTDQYGPALGSLAVTVLDTPSTASAVTYKVQARVDDNASSMIVYLPRATGSMPSGDTYIGYASITVMEIAA